MLLLNNETNGGNMIEETLEKLDNSTMSYEIVYKDDKTLSLDITSNQEMYGIVSSILSEYGIEDAGLAGGGFEHYPLNNGTFLAIGFNTDGPNKFHLGKMGKAF